MPDASRVSDWNRYAYVRGNPLKFNDPTGHFSEEQLIGWYGENWRDNFSQAWIDILLDRPGSEILGAQLGDIVLMGGGTDAERRAAFVLDETGGQLTLWDIDNKMGLPFLRGGDQSVGLYRPIGHETGQPKPLLNSDALPATNGGTPYDTLHVKIAGSGPNDTVVAANWFTGQVGGHYIHSSADLARFSAGDAMENVFYGTATAGLGWQIATRTALKSAGPLGTAYGIYQAAYGAYKATKFRNTYQMTPCTPGVHHCSGW